MTILRYPALFCGFAPCWFTPDKDNLVEPRYGLLGIALIPVAEALNFAADWLGCFFFPDWEPGFSFTITGEGVPRHDA